ncbi:hypothetical protein [Sphingomonas echinoides]|uniref:Uncharacterized protein n=1 Tax=Sphingomonas echinoides TaxID=59803 RepID=A0ABU4PLL0_9SPHN|nr:hypothetical protein [Sphingomonas echinoides]MDX5983952.1 hypothetical protein [Sphingomonas echinoides]
MSTKLQAIGCRHRAHGLHIGVRAQDLHPAFWPLQQRPNGVAACASDTKDDHTAVRVPRVLTERHIDTPENRIS